MLTGRHEPSNSPFILWRPVAVSRGHEEGGCSPEFDVIFFIMNNRTSGVGGSVFRFFRGLFDYG